LGPLPPTLSDDAGFLLYWRFTTGAYMFAVQRSGDIGQLNLAAVDPASGLILAQFIDLEYDEAASDSTMALGVTTDHVSIDALDELEIRPPDTFLATAVHLGSQGSSLPAH